MNGQGLRCYQRSRVRVAQPLVGVLDWVEEAEASAPVAAAPARLEACGYGG